MSILSFLISELIDERASDAPMVEKFAETSIYQSKFLKFLYFNAESAMIYATLGSREQTYREIDYLR